MQVTLSDNRTIDCEDKPFKTGAQGKLYFSKDGKYVAKLYIHPDPQQRRIIEAVISDYNVVGDSLYWQQLFGWPMGLIVKPELGVLMLRAAKQSVQLTELLIPEWRETIKPSERLGTWYGHVAMAIKLARAIRVMHNGGLCHSDLSSNNVLVDPQHGLLTVIDCDGLVVPDIIPPAVWGTPRYMAPEIYEGRAKPSRYTDQHALAVLLYQILLFRHPLEGPKRHHTDPDVDDQMSFGSKALYIEHPTDRSNRPRSFISVARLGPVIERLMQRAFVEGLHQPLARPAAAEWEAALVKMSDAVVQCPNPKCPFKFFVLADNQPAVCPWCGARLAYPNPLPLFRMYVQDPTSRGSQPNFNNENYMVVGWPGRSLKHWHINRGLLPGPDISDENLATFEFHPSKGHWLLHNLHITDLKDVSGSSPVSIAPGNSVRLTDGMRLLLGDPAKSRVANVQLFKLR